MTYYIINFSVTALFVKNQPCITSHNRIFKEINKTILGKGKNT